MRPLVQAPRSTQFIQEKLLRVKNRIYPYLLILARFTAPQSIQR